MQQTWGALSSARVVQCCSSPYSFLGLLPLPRNNPLPRRALLISRESISFFRLKTWADLHDWSGSVGAWKSYPFRGSREPVRRSIPPLVSQFPSTAPASHPPPTSP